jgi:hypothetical protein
MAGAERIKMKRRTLAYSTAMLFIAVATLAVYVILVHKSYKPEGSSSGPISIHVTGTVTSSQANEVIFEITISTTSDSDQSFPYTEFALCFGAYLLGPLGTIDPMQDNGQPRQWIHQVHSQAKTITINSRKQFVEHFRLKDYFPIDNKSLFTDGRYQINFKFYSMHLKMGKPADSGPIIFYIKRG